MSWRSRPPVNRPQQGLPPPLMSAVSPDEIYTPTSLCHLASTASSSSCTALAPDGHPATRRDLEDFAAVTQLGACSTLGRSFTAHSGFQEARGSKVRHKRVSKQRKRTLEMRLSLASTQTGCAHKKGTEGQQSPVGGPLQGGHVERDSTGTCIHPGRIQNTQ